MVESRSRCAFSRVSSKLFVWLSVSLRCACRTWIFARAAAICASAR